MSSLVAGATALGGRYRLVRQLGEGGMGVVWEALDLARGGPCAIKFLKDDSDAEGRRRFLREVESARAIAHPNVVRILAVETDATGAPAMVMELLRGESLGARLERESSLSPGQTAAIVSRVASAVHAAHEAGLVHRDLKPDNVFLCESERGTCDVKVLDFGIAKPIAVSGETAALTVTGTLVGTPLYMAPEQAAGERDLDARADVWALAVMVFECLTGQTPVTGDNYGQILARLIRRDIVGLGELRPELPAEICAAVDSCLVERSQRPASALVLGEALAKHADASIAPPPRAPSPAASGAKQDKTWLMVVTPPPEPARKPGAAKLLALFASLAVLGIALGAYAQLRARHAVAAREPPVAAATPTPEEPGTRPAPSADRGEPSSSAGATPVAGAAVPRPGLEADAAASRPTSEAGVRAGGSARVPPRAPRAGASASTPQPARSAPGRLQGGVAADVPF